MAVRCDSQILPVVGRQTEKRPLKRCASSWRRSPGRGFSQQVAGTVWSASHTVGWKQLLTKTLTLCAELK